jgi:hypothetical protein
VGLVIEGVGSSTSKSGGIAWCYGSVPSGSTDYEYITRMTSLPNTLDDTVNPFTGGLSTSSYTISLSANDDVATRLLYTQRKSTLSLAGPITAASTIVGVSGPGNTTLAGSVIYAGDEAILLGTHTAGGQYTGCTRGFWSTTAQAHQQGDFVKLKNGYLRTRRASLVTYDRDTGTESIRWRGFVDTIDTSTDGLTVNVKCRSVLSLLMGATVNRSAPRIDVGEAFVQYLAGASEPGFAASIRGTGYTQRGSKTAAAYVGTFQVGDTAVRGTVSTDGVITISGFPLREWGAPELEGDEDIQRDGFSAPSQTLDESDIYELFVIDGTSQALSTTRALTKWRHPVAVAAALMLSTDATSPSGFDALPGVWGCGAPAEIFDQTAIQAVIDATPDLAIDRLILGWDGDEVDIFEYTQRTLLAPFGFSWTLTDDSKIAIARFQAVAIDEFDSVNTVQPIPHMLMMSGTRENEFDQVVGLFGGLPWRDPEPLLIASRDGEQRDSIRRNLFNQATTLDLDFQTLDVSRRDDASDLLARATQGHYGTPTLYINARDYADTGTSYDLLGAITLDDPGIIQAWFIDNDGSRTSITAADGTFVGRIVSRTYDFETNLYSLGVLLTNWRFANVPRLRAPSAVLNGSSTTTTLTVEQNAFHSGANDTSFFIAGDVVSLWYRDGVEVNSPPESRTVVSTTATTIVINSGFTTGPSGAIVRLADFDDYGSGGYTEREYAFICDEDGFMGASGVTGDVYG